tara:strand:+ start:62 stop:766 length:705 start_codon:yes stop_codon:yes gene_type:complete
MSDIRVENIKNEAGTGAPSFPYGSNVTGVVTATSFKGSGANLTDTPASSLTGTPNITVGTIGAGNINSTGIVTAVTGSFSGNVSIGGTLTYDDVSNVDSVGLITARNGINVTAGVSTFAAQIQANAGAKVTGAFASNITAMAANDVDCSTANYFTKTITGATTFTFSNAPAGLAYGFTMELTCNGSNAVTWPASVKWPLDTAPVLTDAKTQVFVFITDDGGTRWRGASNVDYVN